MRAGFRDDRRSRGAAAVACDLPTPRRLLADSSQAANLARSRLDVGQLALDVSPRAPRSRFALASRTTLGERTDPRPARVAASDAPGLCPARSACPKPGSRRSAPRLPHRRPSPLVLRAGQVALKQGDGEEANDQHAQDDAGSSLAAHGSCASGSSTVQNTKS